MVYSYGLSYIEDEFSFPSILEEVFSVLDELYLSIDKERPEEAKCQLKLTRRASLIPSRVKGCEIRATFDSKDAMGNDFVDSFMYTTDSNGVINFEPMTYNFSRKGTVTFTFDFESEIENIEKLSPYTASSIRAAIENKSVSFSYNQRSNSLPVAICVQCVDYMGNTNDSLWLADYMIDRYKNSDVEAFGFEYIEDESEEEMVQRFRETHPEGNDIVVLRVGIDSVFETRMDVSSIGTEGSVVVYKSSTGEVLYDSGISYANGFGSSLEEAQKDAFENFVLKMLTLLKAYYV